MNPQAFDRITLHVPGMHVVRPTTQHAAASRALTGETGRILSVKPLAGALAS